MIGAQNIRVDDLMLNLINSKSYNVDKGVVLGTPELKLHFQALNIVINNVIADITKNMTTDNSF